MDALFEYKDDEIYCHHSLDPHPQPEKFLFHAHEMPEVYCFLSGRGSFLVEGTHYSLSPGDLLLLRPAEAHRMMILPDEPYERIAIHFPLALFDSLDPSRALLRPFFDRELGVHNRYAAQDHPGLHPLIGQMTPSRFQIISRLMRLLTELSSLRGFASPGPERPGDFAQTLVRYVNEHLYEPLSLQGISDGFQRSASQISRVFRQATGTSLWEYVMIKRLLAARARLQRGDGAVSTALACGFADYSSFYRAYTRRFGHSPSADRE